MLLLLIENARSRIVIVALSLYQNSCQPSSSAPAAYTCSALSKGIQLDCLPCADREPPLAATTAASFAARLSVEGSGRERV